MKIVSTLLSLYILTKPFYLWDSGLPQISDLILTLAFIIILLISSKDSIRRVLNENKYFIYFLIFVVVINMLYAIYYYDTSFLLHGLYYVFDAVGIIVFVLSLKNIDGFDKVMKNSFKLSLIIQLLIFLLGLGRYYGATRYMGTFNDPNQFAYYCFLSFGFIFLLSHKEKKKTDLLFFALSVFLIFESSSTGMLAGMCIFVVLYLIPFIKIVFRNAKRYAIPSVATVVLIVCGCSFIVPSDDSDAFLFFANNPVISRIEQKFSRASGDGDIDLLQERGYDRIYYYPQYLLYGAGEGRYSRFEKAYHQYEMHATLPSLLFCYGLIPTAFVVIWIYKKIKGQRFWAMSIYLALLLESFTLINSRQVLFWVIFIIAPYLEMNSDNKLEARNG